MDSHADAMPNGILPPVRLEDFRNFAKRSESVGEKLRSRVFSPDSEKKLDLRFNVRTAAEMVGRGEKTIRDAEAEGLLPEPPKNPETGRRLGYTLEHINIMREHFGTMPWRAPDDPPMILAIQNFKGGVAKTTLTCNLANYFAIKGYRVLVIDCDSQASSTAIFGLNPDVDIDEEEETLYPFFRHGGPQTLHYTLRGTYWPNIALIPSNLGLYDAEYEFAAKLSHSRSGSFVLDRLREGIETVQDLFDIILIDPPPALGMISLSVLRAANAIIVPTPPNNVDFGSTAHFFRMMAATLEEISKQGGERSYSFVKVLITKMSDQKSAHMAIKRIIEATYPGDVLQSVLKDSAEIDNAMANLKTVYEITGAAARTDTHKRCRAYLDAIGREVEILIRKTWPSHHDRLRKEGLL